MNMCIICDKKFTPTNNSRQKICSKECRIKYVRYKARVSRELNKPTRKCRACGSPIYEKWFQYHDGCKPRAKKKPYWRYNNNSNGKKARDNYRLKYAKTPVDVLDSLYNDRVEISIRMNLLNQGRSGT